MNTCDQNDEDATSSDFVNAITTIASQKLSVAAAKGFVYYFFG